MQPGRSFHAKDGRPRAAHLGAAHDDALKAGLVEILNARGAGPASFRRGLGGSQDLQVLAVFGNGAEVVVESETYMGLPICGPEDLIDEIVSTLGVRA